MLRYKKSLFFAILMSIVSYIIFLTSFSNNFLIIYENIFGQLLFTIFIIILIVDNYDKAITEYMFNDYFSFFIYQIKEKMKNIFIFLFSFSLIIIALTIINFKPINFLFIIYPTIIFLLSLIMYLYYYLGFERYNSVYAKIIFIFLSITLVITIIYEGRFLINVNIFSFYKIGSLTLYIYHFISYITLLMVSMLIVKKAQVKYFLKYNWHLFIMLGLSTYFLIIIRMNFFKYDFVSELSLSEYLNIIFYNFKTLDKFYISDGLFVVILPFILLYFSIKYVLLYLNNSNDKIISYSFHKQDIYTNIKNIFINETKNAFLTIFVIFTISTIVYAIYINNSIGVDILKIILYFIRTSIFFSIVLILYNLNIVLEKEIKFYYIAGFLMMLFLYFDVNKNKALFLISTSINSELKRIAILLSIALFIVFVFKYIYTKRRDIL